MRDEYLFTGLNTAILASSQLLMKFRKLKIRRVNMVTFLSLLLYEGRVRKQHHCSVVIIFIDINTIHTYLVAAEITKAWIEQCL